MFDMFYPKMKSLAGQDANFKPFFEELEDKVNNKVYLNENKERDALKGQNCLIIGTN